MINRRMNTLSNSPSVDFSKIKVGVKTLEDATLTLSRDKNNPYTKKIVVIQAIEDGDYEEMINISDYYYKTSGIYNRLCRYMAYLYRYDWMVTPYINDESQKTDKLLNTFHKILKFLDEFNAKRFFGEVALKVIKNGCYYGYKIYNNNQLSIQELPSKYCRSRFKVDLKPVVEFNMRYFDDAFKDAKQKMRMLDLFPQEFKKGYLLYKQGKLVPEFTGDTSGWYMLDINYAFKFNINDSDYPVFISVIPAIIDLNDTQELNLQKMKQKLLKIIIQKMPFDKNGDMIFDPDEAAQLHNNAVAMLKRAIGIDVLTTFADVEVASMNDNSVDSSADDLSIVEREVFNEAGVSQKQFNTDGNIALEKSILNDEASIYNLIIQFEEFLNDIIKPLYKNPNKVYYKVQILSTTIYNYKDMSKMYKEQMQIGFSKLLPQIALGQSQSMILASAYFENEILDLVTLFIPPMMSSTMNVEAMTSVTGKNKEGGRPTNEEAGKETSDKTLANKEALG